MGSDNNKQENLIMFPVPEGVVPEVYALVAKHYVQRDKLSLDSSFAVSIPSAQERARKEWTKSEIKELKELPLSSTVEAMLDLTASRAGEWVTFADIWSKAGKEQRPAQGELAGFSQLVRQRFNRQGQDEWPVQVKVGETNQTQYRMSKLIASWWNEDRIDNLEDLASELDEVVERCERDVLGYRNASKVIGMFFKRVMDALDDGSLDYSDLIEIVDKVSYIVEKRRRRLQIGQHNANVCVGPRLEYEDGDDDDDNEE